MSQDVGIIMPYCAEKFFVCLFVKLFVQMCLWLILCVCKCVLAMYFIIFITTVYAVGLGACLHVSTIFSIFSCEARVHVYLEFFEPPV